MMPGKHVGRGRSAAAASFAGCLVAVLLVIPGAVRGQDAGGIGIGQPAPAIQALDVAGRPVSFSAVGPKPVLIEFWATWCPYCARLEPKMKALHARYGDRVRFVAVAVNVNESLARVGRYAAGHGLRYSVLYDASGAASRDYDVPATSFVVVADAGGRVSYTGLGDGQDLQAALDRVLRQPVTGAAR